MQKLSVEVLEKMLGADLSNHEIDMMLYIARFQYYEASIVGL